jgi:hypothetical protein
MAQSRHPCDETCQFYRVIAAQPWSIQHLPLHSSTRDAPLLLRNPLARATRRLSRWIGPFTILALFDQIRDQHIPLAEALEDLVHDFRFDTIMTLTQ